MPKKAKTISNTQHVDALNLAATHRNIPAQAIPLPQAIPSTQLVVKNSDALQNDSDATRDSLDTRRQKQTSAQRNYLLGEVQNRLSRYLTYPQRARRRGWQGEVMVAFQINTRGMLNNVHLAKSSGYSLLDQSAIAAISKLEKITLPEKLKPLQAMELLLPVSYQLREG